ncbi:MAG TPA: hypothetical protein VEV44_07680 [Pseudoneobacillus sp.]|nr:hypothetical protein [Pseudoneobacillus sp.]
MKELTKMSYCEQCGKETLHLLREDALEIESVCKECHHDEEIVKSFF